MSTEPNHVEEIEEENTHDFDIEKLEREIDGLEDSIWKEDEEDEELHQHIRNRAAMMKIIPQETKHMHPIAKQV